MVYPHQHQGGPTQTLGGRSSDGVLEPLGVTNRLEARGEHEMVNVSTSSQENVKRTLDM